MITVLHDIESPVGCLAKWYEPGEHGRVICRLCARYCHIAEGSRGFCFIRRNIGGRLYNTAYGQAIGLAVDPIEKKPLYHFYPGSSVLSFGTQGCNLACRYCQNWQMSKSCSDIYEKKIWSADELVGLAVRDGCKSIAYTYNEPTIFGEWLVDVACSARQHGLKNVMVTNGYVSVEAREELFKDIDAANVDLKSFSEAFYQKITSSHLEPVLETLRWLCTKTPVWTEITTLLIPGENDSPIELKDLSNFIAGELGTSVPLHLTAFHGDYQMMDYPPTSEETLIMARDIALQAGLKYVYLGNISTREGRDTRCPVCGKLLIAREPYVAASSNLFGTACPACNTVIPGRFNSDGG
jgi:pyruvate formate lyase activating enzyme